ncbi:hypothetical protein [Methylobacterium sp. J-090]|uniref:hypothetical protein n=1 Tax=Methylobacterium sp. J-090 TaxID=2836666 RepID=UPI001FB9CABC|nr:hypothetical protein [Methylobacterium sp. J-090]MCJ2082912.1 hypothetical protein [Methylobacterium sp. J-090]
MMSGKNPHRLPAATIRSHTVFNESAMLARIGEDLRDFYGDVDASSLPNDLLRLANLVDGKRRRSNEDSAAS